jgi:CRISPR/Cas system-associated endoribonuclease Cas2
MLARTTLLATSILLTTTGLVLADSASRQRDIDATQAREAREIEQGRFNGNLTRSEYRALLAEQARIRDLERAALADGRISKREYREIHAAQNNAVRHIQAESNDGQVSFWRRWLYRNRY